jgi:hypothetical protein
MIENKYLTILISIIYYSTHQYVLWANEWGSIILWYHLRCLLHSWPLIITLWATIATHLWPKMAENGWKTCFGDVYLHNLLFYTQIWFKGQQVVFNYPMVTYKVPTTLMTPYSYPKDHLSHSFMYKNGQKRLKKRFLMMLTSITFYSTHKYFLRVLIGIQLSYGMSQGAY